MFIRECMKRLKDRQMCRLIARVVVRRVLRYSFRGMKMAVVVNGPVAAVYTGYHVRTGNRHAIFMMTGALLVVQVGDELKAVAVNKEHAAMLNPHGKMLEDLLGLAAETAGNMFP